MIKSHQPSLFRPITVWPTFFELIMQQRLIWHFSENLIFDTQVSFLGIKAMRKINCRWRADDISNFALSRPLPSKLNQLDVTFEFSLKYAMNEVEDWRRMGPGQAKHQGWRPMHARLPLLMSNKSVCDTQSSKIGAYELVGVSYLSRYGGELSQGWIW